MEVDNGTISGEGSSRRAPGGYQAHKCLGRKGSITDRYPITEGRFAGSTGFTIQWEDGSLSDMEYPELMPEKVTMDE